MSDFFEFYLSIKPSIWELDAHVGIGKKWYLLGNLLGCETEALDRIEAQDKDDKHKTKEMFQLWLTGPVSRRKILECLRNRFIGENAVAELYEAYLKEKLSGKESE